MSGWYWRTYNVLRRVVGLGFTLVALASLWVDLAPASAARVGGLTAVGQPPSPGVALLWALPFLALGLALLRARPYRPDLGDVSWWAGRAGGYAPGVTSAGSVRRWWTGGYRPGVRDA